MVKDGDKLRIGTYVPFQAHHLLLLDMTFLSDDFFDPMKQPAAQKAFKEMVLEPKYPLKGNFAKHMRWQKYDESRNFQFHIETHHELFIGVIEYCLETY